MKNKKSKTGFLVLAVLLCLGIVWVCTITGAASVSISDANRILLNKLFHLLVKRKILFASSLLTASVISITGIIGFVCLVVPHVVRLLTVPKHRRLLPVSMVFGGAFMVICDTAARSLTTSEIPVGIITSICGGPFFLYLLRKSKKGGGVV